MRSRAAGHGRGPGSWGVLELCPSLPCQEGTQDPWASAVERCPICLGGREPRSNGPQPQLIIYHSSLGFLLNTDAQACLTPIKSEYLGMKPRPQRTKALPDDANVRLMLKTTALDIYPRGEAGACSWQRTTLPPTSFPQERI